MSRGNVYPGNDEQILKDSIFKVGRVTSVRGRSIDIQMDKTKNVSHLMYKGDILKNVSVGSYVKIFKGFTKIIGKIEGEYIKEDKYSTKSEYEPDYKLKIKKAHYVKNKEYSHEREKIDRILNVSLLGFFGSKGFERGIKELPLIDNECFLLEKDEFNAVHHFVTKGDEPITIGSLSLEKGQVIQVGINSLFASHIGIFGNTGSGKSYTLAKIYKELFDTCTRKKYKNFMTNGKFLLFDFNGEYERSKCIAEGKKVYNLTTRKKADKIDTNHKFPLNEKDLIDIELISILANATEKTQKPFISRTLKFYKKVYNSDNPDQYIKDTLKNRVKDVLQMTDKDKSYILIDYLMHIVTEKESDPKEKLFSEIEWNNKNHHFMKKSGECKALENSEIEDITLYKSVDDYKFPENILSKIIHFLYLQLIFDVYTDKAHNEHIAPAINKLKSKKDDIEKVLNTQNTHNNVFNENYNLVILNLKDVNLEIKKLCLC